MTRLVPGYQLRAATVADFAPLNHIEQAAARIFPPGFLPAEVLDDKLPFGVLEQARQQNGLWLVQRADGTPVGYVVLESVAGLTLLAQIDVHPAHARQGLGAALVNHALVQVQARGGNEVWLTTFSNVPWNAPFYQKLGFCTVDEATAPDAIRDILREERARGLQQRVAMRWRHP
ncbi:GNAT family N-acetyltransferase [Enterobacteriaceae bacterium 4M9]|nr:GNAT family N-acetyltransferase [Enterobacteriaceae bacterium 4M9]